MSLSEPHTRALNSGFSSYATIHTLAIPLKDFSSLSVLTLKVVCRVKMLLIVCMWCVVVLNYT